MKKTGMLLPTAEGVSKLSNEGMNGVLTDVPVALIGIEPDGHSSRVSDRVGTSSRAIDCREAHERRGHLARLGKDLHFRQPPATEELLCESRRLTLAVVRPVRGV